jgi:serine/threonine-protein kinase RsbT
MNEPHAARVRIASESDIAEAVRESARLGRQRGLASVEARQLATAVSEAATNALKYAGGGEAVLEAVERQGRSGVMVVVRDSGPGIADPRRALREGHSTGGSLGLGLPGARRLVDEFALDSADGAGTAVTLVKWRGGGDSATPIADWQLVAGERGEAFLQPFRNGVLLGAVAGPGASAAAAACRAQAWRAPTVLATACLAVLARGERLDVALASLSALDSRLSWLRAGAAEGELLREGDPPRRAPALPALAAGHTPLLRAAELPVRRDDVLTLAAGDAAVEARVGRGALERRPRPDG